MLPSVEPVADDTEDVGFVTVPKPLGSVVLPNVAADDDAEKLKSGVNVAVGTLVLATLVLKKPGLAYAAELSKAVGSDDGDDTFAPIPVTTSPPQSHLGRARRYPYIRECTVPLHVLAVAGTMRNEALWKHRT